MGRFQPLEAENMLEINKNLKSTLKHLSIEKQSTPEKQLDVPLVANLAFQLTNHTLTLTCNVRNNDRD
jgi:hypothetical protein